MRDMVNTNNEQCIGCNKCVRECPMETANITYQDEDDNIKVKVDHKKCIACGRCVYSCKHDARYYEDDTKLFFNDLLSGIPISLIAAPSIRTNIPEYKRLFTYLKKAGVKKIYDVSLGADICIWAHVRYLEHNNPAPLITQPCPVIVSYCEMYRHDLLKSLSPVHSPMGCIAVYMREYEGIQDRIAALSPCIAKANEFEATKLQQYNVTFIKLREYLEKNHIELPEEETGFDHYESGLGSLFPMPGGLKENIEFFTGKKLHIFQAEGFSVYEKLNTYAKTPDELLPAVFDVLNCIEGCNIGPACLHNKSIFEIDVAMKKSREAAADNRDKEYFDSLYKAYDKKFKFSDFMREYQPVDISFPLITDKDIQEAFTLLDKNNYAKQNVDCGACGSDTCYSMARKIALKVNIPESCVIKSRDDAKEEHKKNLIAYEENIKQTEMARDMLEQFKTVWNNVESGIAIIDAETREVIDINPIAVRMFGSSKEEMIGNTCYNLICPAKECPVIDKKQLVDKAEQKFIKSDGETIPIIKSVAKIHYNGRLALLESFTDISYLKQAEEQLRILKVTEQASHAKSDFLSKMSHEMRTPMNAIIGMTQIAGKSNELDKLKYCLSMIENSSTHLLGLINDILDMSKIEAGKFELENTSINIEKMLIRVCNLIIEKIELKNIKFDIVLGTNMRMNYIGDELRLSQVVTNLMSNSVKFTPDDGRIELSVDEVQKDNDYGILRFTVKDSGIGMTEEQMGRLFNAFEQAESSTSRKFGGTGLGLAISKNIVEKMNGRIWVESEIGKGSAFIFEVKLKRPAQQDSTVIFRNIQPKDVNLLVLDGDRDERIYFKSITDSFGVNTDEADNADRAVGLVKLAKAAQKPYDVIFVDWSQSEKDGVDVIRRLTELIDKNTVIVVMASFLKWNKIEKDVNKMGVNRFISKPFFPSIILNLVSEVIGETAKAIDVKSEHTSDVPDFSNVMMLFAEDVEINREIFIALLEETKLNIDIAENGMVAFQKFKENPDKYDIVIMDVQMPEMDGYEATRSIRSLDVARAKAIPIIAMTANVFKEDIDKCIASGMNDHLAKPIDIKAVNEKISLYCGLTTK